MAPKTSLATTHFCWRRCHPVLGVTMSKNDNSNAYICHLVDKVLSQVRLSPHEQPPKHSLVHALHRNDQPEGQGLKTCMLPHCGFQGTRADISLAFAHPIDQNFAFLSNPSPAHHTCRHTSPITSTIPITLEPSKKLVNFTGYWSSPSKTSHIQK
jgi:hypothetical protein